MIDMIKAVSENVMVPDNVEIRDGKRYCKDCGDCLDHEQYFPHLGKKLTVGVICSCIKSKLAETDEKRESVRKKDEKAAVFEGREHLRGWTFEMSDAEVNLSAFQKGGAYVDGFRKALRCEDPFKECNGLMLYGEPGTGKTYLAACIVNELLNRGFKVVFTSIRELIDKIQSADFSEKDAILEQKVTRPHLLVLDDFGVERMSEYMQEQMFKIIDSRYATRKPLIITTNLSPVSMIKAKTVQEKRIFSRIMECCYDIQLTGDNLRLSGAGKARKSLDEYFMSETL